MNIETCNGFLEVIALLNDGANHISDYSLELLPDAATLNEALGQYFSKFSTSRVPPQPPESWYIRIVPIAGGWPHYLEKASHHWFFEQEYSPKLEEEDTRKDIVNRFLEYLEVVVGDAAVYQVEISPPMWYECLWQDIALESNRNRYFLHFGFSD